MADASDHASLNNIITGEFEMTYFTKTTSDLINELQLIKVGVCCWREDSTANSIDSLLQKTQNSLVHALNSGMQLDMQDDEWYFNM